MVALVKAHQDTDPSHLVRLLRAPRAGHTAAAPRSDMNSRRLIALAQALASR
jgi:hypothetical protein